MIDLIDYPRSEWARLCAANSRLAFDGDALAADEIALMAYIADMPVELLREGIRAAQEAMLPTKCALGVKRPYRWPELLGGRYEPGNAATPCRLVSAGRAVHHHALLNSS